MRRSVFLLVLLVAASAGVLAAALRTSDAGSSASTGGEATPARAQTRPPELPADFQRRAAGRQGRVVRVDYRTRYRRARIDKHAYVYLPAGYSQRDDARYDVLYLMHGAGMDTESFFGGAGRSSVLKNILDHMIEAGQIKPMIVVTPTFYPDGDASLDLHYAGQLDRIFPRELERDLMPAVEATYRTFARTPNAAGFEASREHRAFGGFSMGAVTTWYAFIDSLENFKYFMPMAGDSWVIDDSGGATEPERTAAYLSRAAQRSGYDPADYLIAASVGSADGTTYQLEPQIREMRKHPESFDESNLRYTVDRGGGHDAESLYQQLYTSLPLVF